MKQNERFEHFEFRNNEWRHEWTGQVSAISSNKRYGNHKLIKMKSNEHNENEPKWTLWTFWTQKQ